MTIKNFDGYEGFAISFDDLSEELQETIKEIIIKKLKNEGVIENLKKEAKNKIEFEEMLQTEIEKKLMYLSICR